MVAARLEPAFEPAPRRNGLLGRARLAPDAALIIAPTSSIHTFFMQFPIDVLFVGRHGEVLKACQRVGPWNVRFAWRGFAVVECEAGVISRSGTAPGDHLSLELAPIQSV